MRNRISQFIRWLREDERSPQWNMVRKEVLILNHRCAWCGGEKDLQVHHIIPFHIAPEKELDKKNLIVLCESMGVNCHLYHGHLGDWKKWNPLILEDIASKNRVYYDPSLCPPLS